MSDPAPSILEGLNEPQQEAVKILEGPLLILAGAGSGKTRVVTRRIANLIYSGVQPWEILAITFTNKASGEMRTRVEDLVGESGVWVSTFHSLCARLMRREAEYLGMSPNFSIYDDDDSVGLIKEIMKKQNISLDDPKFKPKKVRGLISTLKNQNLQPDDIDPSTLQNMVLQNIYREYQNGMLASDAVDFDDLLFKGVELLRDHEEVRKRYQRRFRYLLIDEYQDTNGCQYELVKLLGGGHRNVCATGDPDQSIYAWRGADVKNILSFEEDFPDAKVVRLEQNYRSSKRILAVASAVIKNNRNRKEKDLWTENEDGEQIRLIAKSDDRGEAHEVVGRIQKMISHGEYNYNDFAVFYRTNAQSRAFEDTLIESGIPYRLVGGTPFYARKEIKDALAYLRLAMNPKDDVSLRRVINQPRRGIGKTTIELLAAKADGLSCSMLEALDQTDWMEKELKPKQRKELYKFARMMDTFRTMPQYPVAEALRTVLEMSGLRGHYEKNDEDERLQNLDELVNAAAIYDSDNLPGEEELDAFDAPFEEIEELASEKPQKKNEEEPDARYHSVYYKASVAGFLENAALIQSTDDLDTNVERVTLMTFHMAKGLEFPVVFMVGLDDGLMPMIRSNNQMGSYDETDAYDQALEEERRLFYVGVTRAMEQLFLLRANRRYRYGKLEFQVSSPFLDEIPEEHLVVEGDAKSSWEEDTFDWNYDWEKKKGRGQSGRSASFNSFGKTSYPKKKAKKANSFGDFERTLDDDSEEYNQDPGGGFEYERQIDADANEEFDFNVGDQVLHHRFGQGTILGFSGDGASFKVKVKFRTAGTKQLLYSLAKLKKA